MKTYQKLQFLRKQHNMSQEELADKLGVSRQSVYKWESGINDPELEKLKAISELFGVSFDYLLNDSIDSEQTSAPTQPTKQKFRKPFRSKNSLPSVKAESDHGYVSDSYGRNRRSEEIYQAASDEFNKAVAAREYTTHFRLQPDMLVEFFSDQKRAVIGFFWDGAEQFVCPYENIVTLTVNNNGPSSSVGSQDVVGGVFGSGHVGIGVGRAPVTRVNPPVLYKLDIVYYANEGKTEKYTVNLTCSRKYAIENAKDADVEYHALMSALSAATGDSLNQISSAVTVAKNFLQRNETENLPEIDFEVCYREIAKGERAARDRATNILAIQKEEGKHNTLVKLLTFGSIGVLAVLAVVLFIWMYAASH